MSGKSSFLILRRFRAGDEDLILKVYGEKGQLKILVPEALKVDRGLSGYVEPFNLIGAVCVQKGELLILKDITSAEFFSYLALRSYSRYVWMCQVVGFVERWFLHYDAELFGLALRYLTLDPADHQTLLLKFKLDFLRFMGLYKEDIFKEEVRGFVRKLQGEEDFRKLQRLKLPEDLIKSVDDAIMLHLQSSL